MDGNRVGQLLAALPCRSIVSIPHAAETPSWLAKTRLERTGLEAKRVEVEIVYQINHFAPVSSSILRRSWTTSLNSIVIRSYQPSTPITREEIAIYNIYVVVNALPTDLATYILYMLASTHKA
jgi:hypothetical protein